MFRESAAALRRSRQRQLLDVGPVVGRRVHWWYDGKTAATVDGGVAVAAGRFQKGCDAAPDVREPVRVSGRVVSSFAVSLRKVRVAESLTAAAPAASEPVPPAVSADPRADAAAEPAGARARLSRDETQLIDWLLIKNLKSSKVSRISR